MREIVHILGSDAMIILYESVAILVLGVLNVRMGKTCKEMRREKEEEQKRIRKEKLQDSLTNDKADLRRI